MKKIVTIFIIAACTLQSCAQSTPEALPQISFSSTESTNYNKYIGTSGKENKINTEIMYKKMKEINTLFEAAFKNTKGVTGTWRAQVDDISNEGLVKGNLQIWLHPTYYESKEQLNKDHDNTLTFSVLINDFEHYVVRDKKKASGFTAKNDKDSINGHLIYLISEVQEEESFKGFPMYYSGWNNRPEQSFVIITKPDQPLFNPIIVSDFLELFKKWATAYNLQKPNDKFNESPEHIEKFISTYKPYTKDFYNKPCITLWDRTYQSPYTRRGTYVDDVTMGNPWVIFNPAYINKNAAAASVQFITIEWTKGPNAASLKAFKDFENNFDFKKLQSLLGN